MMRRPEGHGLPLALSLLLVASPALRRRSSPCRRRCARRSRPRPRRCGRRSSNGGATSTGIPSSGFARPGRRRSSPTGCARSKFDEVRTGVGVTGVVGDAQGRTPGKLVAIRADMDALPIPELIDVPYKSTVANVKHACGHDAHVTIALGVAELFSQLRARDSRHGDVLLPARRGRRPRRRPHRRAAHAGRWADEDRCRRRCSACT